LAGGGVGSNGGDDAVDHTLGVVRVGGGGGLDLVDDGGEAVTGAVPDALDVVTEVVEEVANVRVGLGLSLWERMLVL
jgi:hypothetical protein